MTSGAWTPTLERLVAVGRERGYVTVAEINAALSGREAGAEMVEHLLARLSNAGAVVTEEVLDLRTKRRPPGTRAGR